MVNVSKTVIVKKAARHARLLDLAATVTSLLRKAFSCARRSIDLISKVRRAVQGAHATNCVTRVRRADVDIA